MGEAPIEIAGLSHRFGQERALNAVDLVLERGKLTVLLGASGSGKTTLLTLIGCLRRVQEGSVRLLGTELAGADEALLMLMRRRLGFIFQSHNLHESLTAMQNVRMGLEVHGAAATTRWKEAAAHVLGLLGLADRLDYLPGNLSGGQKQRVAIARAFAAEPRLVLCDEVTSALDVSVQAAVLALLDRLRGEKGTTYVFVSHDLAVVRAICDRVAVLYQGRLCEIGPAAAVYATPCHPYTEALMGAALEPTPGARPKLLAADIVERSPPAHGCPFQRRCHRKLGSICETSVPPARQAAQGHLIHCHIEVETLAAIQAPAGGAPA